jgi:hypothetical protein
MCICWEIASKAGWANDFFLFNETELLMPSENYLILSLDDGYRLYKSSSHYGAADKEGQIVGMRGAARGMDASGQN